MASCHQTRENGGFPSFFTASHAGQLYFDITGFFQLVIVIVIICYKLHEVVIATTSWRLSPIESLASIYYALCNAVRCVSPFSNNIFFCLFAKKAQGNAIEKIFIASVLAEQVKISCKNIFQT